MTEQSPSGAGISCMSWTWDLQAPKSISQTAQEKGTRAAEEAGVARQPGI